MLLFFMLHCTNKTWKNLVHGIEESIHYIFCFFLTLVPRAKNVGVTQTNERTKV
jgi:hypothetical protein